MPLLVKAFQWTRTRRNLDTSDNLFCYTLNTLETMQDANTVVHDSLGKDAIGVTYKHLDLLNVTYSNMTTFYTEGSVATNS